LYDIGVIGYTDVGNRDFAIEGYRLEALGAKSGGESSLCFKIIKVQDDGGSKMSLVTMEDICVNNNDKSKPNGEMSVITDHIRTGVHNRDYTSSTDGLLWPDDTTFVLKQGDFDDIYTTENRCECSTKDEGIMILIEAASEMQSIGAPSGSPYQRTQIRYYYL
jgi:hypothetical protein